MSSLVTPVIQNRWFPEEEVLEQLLPLPCPCTSPSSQSGFGRGFLLGFPKSCCSFLSPGATKMLVFAGSLQGTKCFSPGSEKSLSPLSHALADDSDWVMDFDFLPAQIHLRSIDVLQTEAHLSVLCSSHNCRFLACS